MSKTMKKFKSVKILLTLAVVFVMSLAVGSQSEAAAPAKVTGLKQVKTYTNAVSLEWKALLNNDVYYSVDISTNKKTWVNKEDKCYSNTEYLSGLNAGSTYYVRVRAYTQSTYNGPKTWGAYSSVLEVVTAPNSGVSKIKHTKSTGTSISLSWSSVPGANRYRVEYRREDADWDSPWKAVYVTGRSTTLKKLSGNRRYDIRVYPVRQTKNAKVKAIGSSPKYIYDVPVVPGKSSGLTCPYYWDSLGEVKMECTRKKAADGYQWELYTSYKSKNKKLKTVYTTSNTAYIKHSYLKKHNFYKVRVRAYCKNDSGKKYYGSWSSWDYISQQPDVKLRSTKSGIKASWDKIAGADRYVVYVSTKQKSGYKKFCTTRGTSKTITKYGSSKLKSGKYYYVYVVAQNKSGKTYYSGTADYCWKLKYKK